MPHNARFCLWKTWEVLRHKGFLVGIGKFSRTEKENRPRRGGWLTMNLMIWVKTQDNKLSVFYDTMYTKFAGDLIVDDLFPII